MGVLAVMGVVGAGAWVVTPLASMLRRGTIDQRTVEGWRAEADRADRAAAVSRARRRSAVVASIPAPRGSEHDQQRSAVHG